MATMRKDGHQHHSTLCANQNMPGPKFASTSIGDSDSRVRGYMTGKTSRAAAAQGAVDAIGSYTLKRGSHTQRENSDLQDITDPNPKLASTIEGKDHGLSHLEVTDRLYNKKQIQKMRMKSGNIK